MRTNKSMVFTEEVTNKYDVLELKDMIKKTGRDILIEVDGGVKRENAEKVVKAGADVLVMGTGLFRADDPKAVVCDVLACAEE